MLVTWFREGYVSKIIQKFVKFTTPDLPSLRVAFPEDACALLMDAYLSERKDGKGEIYYLKGFMRWPWVMVVVFVQKLTVHIFIYQPPKPKAERLDDSTSRMLLVETIDYHNQMLSRWELKRKKRTIFPTVFQVS